MRRLCLTFVACLTSLSLPVFAGDKEVIDYRKNVIGAAGRSAVALSAIAQGKLEQSESFADIARLMAEAAALAPAAFATDTRGTSLDTNSKDVIWEEWDDFASRMEAYAEDAATVAALAEAGDMEAAQKALFPMFKAHCKGCHDKYQK